MKRIITVFVFTLVFVLLVISCGATFSMEHTNNQLEFPIQCILMK